MNIQNLLLKKTAMLAPMASVADKAYRTMCKRYGASYIVSEMVSAKAICYNDKKSLELLKISEYEAPMAIQLFGSEPEIMANAAKTVARYCPSTIDINMGCPVPKVAGNGCGSALMKTPERAYDIVYAMKNAVDIPVTVKIRKGWDEKSVTAAEFAMLMEKAGADAITIHGRTKTQMYRPPVDLNIIKAVKSSVNIPVIGNGGITSGEDAKEMYDKTGCDLVAIGQGSYGRPWIFEDIERYLTGKPPLPEKSLEEKLFIMLEHISLLVADKGEKIGMKEARTQAAFYIKGEKSAAKFRRECGLISTYQDIKEIANKMISENHMQQEV